jgi:hypothetical protein
VVAGLFHTVTAVKVRKQHIAVLVAADKAAQVEVA